jgi:hypothetical protein
MSGRNTVASENSGTPALPSSSAQTCHQNGLPRKPSRLRQRQHRDRRRWVNDRIEMGIVEIEQKRGLALVLARYCSGNLGRFGFS